MNNLYSYTRDEYSKKIIDLSYSAHHGKDIFRLLYKGPIAQIQNQSGWSGFPTGIIKKFSENYSHECPQIIGQHSSLYDQSEKFILRLRDGAEIEMVLMPETKRITLCISSQVGCSQGCVFCHTGRMGLKRNLDVGEIIGQIVVANEFLRSNLSWLQERRLPSFMRVTNVVFMGMGEPLDNVANVLKSIKIMTDPYGLNLTLRKITVSTAGHLEGLKTLFEEIPEVRLALSLHSPFDSERSRIMPINRKWPLKVVIEAIKEIQSANQAAGKGQEKSRGLSSRLQKGGIEVFIQYTLLKGVNDSPNHAEALCKIIQGLRAKINLIPLNPVSFSRLEAPDFKAVQEFRAKCQEAGFRVLVRYSKGQDIAAACGQLVKSGYHSS